MREIKRKAGSGNNTITKMQGYIRAILEWGKDQDLIHLNPWRDYKRLPAKKYVIKTSIDDFRQLISYCSDWLKWALATAYALAMRPGQVELFRLQWTDFNWRFGYVQYARGKTGRLKRVVPPPAYWEETHKRYLEDMAAGIPLLCHRAGKRVLSYHSA